MPVFIKKGAFFVLDKNNIGNGYSNPKHLSVIPSMAYGKYVLLEDDDNEKLLKTTFINKKNQISIKVRGSKEVYQKDRIYSFKILNVHKALEVKVLGANLVSYTTSGEFLEITVNDVKINEEVIISYIPVEIDKVSKIRRDILTRLMYLDDINPLRNDLYHNIVKSNTKKELSYHVKHSNLTAISKDSLLEMIRSK